MTNPQCFHIARMASCRYCHFTLHAYKINTLVYYYVGNIFIFHFQVITWATYHKDDPPPPEDDENKEKRTDDISSWDSDFLKVDQGTLFELILAANYLDIKVNYVFPSKPINPSEINFLSRLIQPWLAWW